MSKLDFNSYLVSELSKVLHNDDFMLNYVYRHHNKPSIILKPLVDDEDDVALRELKQLCTSSKLLGHRYIISLEHVTFKFFASSSDGKVNIHVSHEYELTMPNNPDFKYIVNALEEQEIENKYNVYNFLKKGGVK